MFHVEILTKANTWACVSNDSDEFNCRRLAQHMSATRNDAVAVRVVDKNGSVVFFANM